MMTDVQARIDAKLDRLTKLVERQSTQIADLKAKFKRLAIVVMAVAFVIVFVALVYAALFMPLSALQAGASIGVQPR